MTLLQSAIFDTGEMATAIAAWKEKRAAEFQSLGYGHAGPVRSRVGDRWVRAAAARSSRRRAPVERHQVLQLRSPRLHQRLLRQEQRALRVEHVEVAGDAGAVAQVGEAIGDRQRVGLRRQRPHLLAEGGAAGQRVGDLAEGASGSPSRTAPPRCRGWPRRARGWRGCAPASKIGCSSCAVPVKAQLPLLNRPESSVLAVPKLAVSEMRGKKAARAAPMLALAAISCCSAARMSGRRISSSDGRPAGTSTVELPFVERQRRRQVGRHGAGRPAAPARSRRARAGAASARARRARLRAATRPAGSRARTTTPLSKRSLVRRVDSSRVASVCRVTREQLVVGEQRRGRSSATLPTRLICTALRASSVARYWRAPPRSASGRGRRGRARSRSPPRRRCRRCRSLPLPVGGARRAAADADASGHWSARRDVVDCARACSMLSTATRRSRLLASARSIRRFRRGSAKKSLPGDLGRRRAAPAAAAGVVREVRAGTGAAGRS